MIEIEDKLKEISKAIKSAELPEELQKIAFSKMMDKLLDENSASQKKKSSGKKRNHNSKTIAVVGESKKLQEDVDTIIKSMSRSKHSVIYNLKSSLDQYLYIIYIAEKENSIKGLTPSQISSILRGVFKISKTQAAVSMALMNAVKYTDRKKINLPGTFAYKYEIMHQGEEHILRMLKENKKENHADKSEDKSEPD